MALAPGDVIRLTVFQRLYSQRVLTVLHMRVTVPATPGFGEFEELQELAQQWADPAQNPLIDDWRGLVVEDLEFEAVRVQKIFPTRSIYAQGTMGFPGQVVQSAKTPNIAASIEKRTSRPGRRGIGRVQMAGVPEGNIVAGVGFTIYALNNSELFEPLEAPKGDRFKALAAQSQGGLRASVGGKGTRIYGQWTVSWSWR